MCVRVYINMSKLGGEKRPLIDRSARNWPFSKDHECCFLHKMNAHESLANSATNCIYVISCLLVMHGVDTDRLNFV